MKRTFEITLVLIVSVLTISATGTVIHDLNSGKTDPLATWLSREWKAVATWARGTAVPALVHPQSRRMPPPPTLLHSNAELSRNEGKHIPVANGENRVG